LCESDSVIEYRSHVHYNYINMLLLTDRPTYETTCYWAVLLRHRLFIYTTTRPTSRALFGGGGGEFSPEGARNKDSYRREYSRPPPKRIFSLKEGWGESIIFPEIYFRGGGNILRHRSVIFWFQTRQAIILWTLVLPTSWFMYLGSCYTIGLRL